MFKISISITDMTGGEKEYKVSSTDDLISQLESETGINFNRMDLFSEDVRLTKSRNFMDENLKDVFKLFSIVSDKPIRLMDKDIIAVQNTINEQEYDLLGSLWNARDERLEHTFGKVEDWDVSFITDMNHWFAGGFTESKMFNRDISKWDVSSVKDFHCMFSVNIKFNQNIKNWDVSNADDLSEMFIEADAFDQNLSCWRPKKDANASDMFNRCYNCHQYMDDIIDSWDCLPFGTNNDMDNFFYDSEENILDDIFNDEE